MPAFYEDMDSFRRPLGSNACDLIWAKRAIENSITFSNIEQILAGARLATMLRRIFLRRTHASRIPFGSGNTIGAFVPRIAAYVIERIQLPKKKAVYVTVSDMHEGKLITPGGSRSPNRPLRQNPTTFGNGLEKDVATKIGVLSFFAAFMSEAVELTRS